jgi:hypothetical protein
VTFEAAIAEVRSAVAKDIVAAAKREHAKIMEAEPRPPGFVRHVDGREGATEEDVSDGGIIVYDYHRIDLVVDAAMDTLRKLSPVASGDYVRSHTIFIGGSVVEDAKNWKPGQEVVLANTVPYARKIEIGGKKFRTHPHVYEKTASILRRLFAGVADISFSYYDVGSLYEGGLGAGGEAEESSLRAKYIAWGYSPSNVEVIFKKRRSKATGSSSRQPGIFIGGK